MLLKDVTTVEVPVSPCWWPAGSSRETLLDNHGNVMSRASKVFVTFDPATPNLGNYPKETIKNMDKMLLKDLQPSFF